MSNSPLNDLSHVTWRLTERRWVRVAGVVVTALVFSAGVLGMEMTKEGREIGPVACIYATCKFFLFHGEPSWLSWQHSQVAVALIGVAAFGGPLLTSAFIALMVRQIAAVVRDRQGVRAIGHIVIFGCGREGIHWATYLHAAWGARIVFVDSHAEGRQLSQARAMGAAVLVGDTQDGSSWHRAAVSKSKVVVVCTGNELVNIDTARAIELKTGPLGPRIFCRVASQSLLFSMRHSATRSSSRIRYFNIYDFVATDALDATLKSAHDAATSAEDDDRVHLIICGFGRFGQAVLHAAGTHAVLFGRLSAVDVVDFRAEILLDEYRFSAPDADEGILKLTSPRRSSILNHDLWAKLLAEPTGTLRVVFICTDNDVTNLAHALAIQRLVRKKQGQDIRAIVVTRQLEPPKNSEAGLLYATLASTNDQIRLLVDQPM